MKQTVTGDFTFRGRGIPPGLFVASTTLVTSRAEGNNGVVRSLHVGPLVFGIAFAKRKDPA